MMENRAYRSSRFVLFVALVATACDNKPPTPPAQPFNNSNNPRIVNDADRSTPPEVKKDAGATPAPAGAAGSPTPGAIPSSSADDMAKLKEFVQEKAGPTPRTPGPDQSRGTGMASPGANAAAAAAAAVEPLKFDAPSEWKPQPVTSGFRRAQYLIPRADGDPEDGQMVLFYFGKNEGGGVEANLQRWRSMFTTAGGEPIDAGSVPIKQGEVNGLKVTQLDVGGRYSDPMMRGSAERTAGDYRLLGAVVETADGNWFFKAVGPAKTMAAQHEAFAKMLSSVKR